MKHLISIRYEVQAEKKRILTHLMKDCINKALLEEQVNVPCEINVLLTDESGIQALNLELRGIDAPTDVLSFPMFTLTPGAFSADGLLDAGTRRLPLGDMAISLPQAQRQAEEYGHSLGRELGFLTVHSVLHLLGYDHMDEGLQKARMREREEAILSQLGLTRDMASAPSGG